MNFKNYIYMMLGLNGESIKRKGRSFKILRVKIKSAKPPASSEQNDSSSESSSIRLKNKLVTTITWFMMIAFLVSLTFRIYFALVQKDAPPELSQIISGTLGYLGGVIAAYMRFSSPDKESK